MTEDKKPIDPAIAKIKEYYDRKQELAATEPLGAYQRAWAKRTFNHANEGEPKPVSNVTLPKLKWMGDTDTDT
jgi:hypothetical protein